jgi:hypothetical protein
LFVRPHARLVVNTGLCEEYPMKLWKLALVIVIVAAGFGTGYLCREQQPPQSDRAVAQQTPTADAPSLYDPSLIIPPPDVDSKGEFLDPPLDEFRKQFQRQIGLATNGNEPPSIVPVDAVIDLPPPLIPAILPPNLCQSGAFAETPLSIAPKPVPHRPAGVRAYTNQRDIRLNFEVARQCVAGINAVELWCRRSPNASYECVDRMDGCKPPFVTRLWSEGDYEFRLVLVDGQGAKTSLTHDDIPDICVCFDTTPPIIEMQRPVVDGAGFVKLSWLAGDRNLDDNPIRLEYAEDGENWVSLAPDGVWLPNTGEYLWNAPIGLSDKVRFRILARDKAGNIAIAPVPGKSERSDYTLPEARINGLVETLPAPKEAPSQKGRIVSAWDKHVTYVADATRPGKTEPSLACRFYLLRPNLSVPSFEDGELIVDLYDCTPNGADSEPRLTDELRLSGTNLRACAKADRMFGDGYTINFPWSGYSSAVKQVSIKMFFTTANGEKLSDQTEPFTIDHSATTARDKNATSVQKTGGEQKYELLPMPATIER